MSTERTITIEAGSADGGSRLDRYLASAIPELSRERVKALIQDGNVTLGGTTIGEASHRVKPGEIFSVRIPAAKSADTAGEALPLDIVYEDKDVIVIDKPAGLVVHPSAGHASGTLVNALIGHCGASLSGIGGVMRPGIVHRLDKDTSGLLVAAKNDAAHKCLAGQFKSHGMDGRLTRAYLALVWGRLARPKGTIDVPLARSDNNRLKIGVARSGHGRQAVTHFEVLSHYDGVTAAGGVSLVRLVLETGRTHQIRVHLAHIGHPVLGDQVYGAGFKTRVTGLIPPAQEALEALGRQALHAAELGFEHPRTAKSMHFESPLPADIAWLLSALQGPGGSAKGTAVQPKAAGKRRR